MAKAGYTLLSEGCLTFVASGHGELCCDGQVKFFIDRQSPEITETLISQSLKTVSPDTYSHLNHADTSPSLSDE